MNKSRMIFGVVAAFALVIALGIGLGLWVKGISGTRGNPNVVSVLENASDDQKLFDAVVATADVFFGAISQTNAVVFTGIVDSEAFYERIPMELKDRLILGLRKQRMIQTIDLALRRNLPQLAAFQPVGTEWRLTSVSSFADGSVKGTFRLIDPDGYSSFTSLFLEKKQGSFQVVDWREEDAGLTMSTAMGLGLAAGMDKDPRLLGTAAFVQRVSPLLVEEDYQAMRVVLDDVGREEVMAPFQSFHDLMNATCYAVEEEWAKSEEVATRILSVEGAYPGAYFLRGNVRAWQDNHEGALADYAMYTNIFGHTSEVLVEMAGVYQSMGATNSAMTHLEWAAADLPTSLDIYYVAAEFVGEADGDWFRGLIEKHKEAVLELGEDLPGYIAWDCEPEALEIVIDVFRKQNPEDYNVHFYTGIVHEQREAYEKAVASYLRAWKLGPEEESYDLLDSLCGAAVETDTPEVLFSQIEAEQAEEVLEAMFDWLDYEDDAAVRIVAAARELAPRELSVDFWEGEVLLSRERWPEVVSLVEQNLERAAASDWYDALVSQWAEAIVPQEDWERGFTLFQKKEAQKIVFEVFADAFYEAGRGEALKRLIAVAEGRIDPGWEKTFWLGIVDVLEGAWRSAGKTLEGVAEDLPEDEWLENYILGEALVVVYARQGRVEDALNLVEQEELHNMIPTVHAFQKDRDAVIAALVKYRRWALDDASFFDDERWFLEAIKDAGFSLEALLADAAKKVPDDEE